MGNNYSIPLKEILEENGCFFIKEAKGDHEIWYCPHNNKRFSVPSFTKSRHTANDILRKQAELDRKL